MIGQYPEKKWYLYDTTSGNIILTHPYVNGMTVLCPHCNKPLIIENYTAECCGNQFKTSFGGIRQVKSIGSHNKMVGRGWQSLRPYE